MVILGINYQIKAICSLYLYKHQSNRQFTNIQRELRHQQTYNHPLLISFILIKEFTIFLPQPPKNSNNIFILMAITTLTNPFSKAFPTDVFFIPYLKIMHNISQTMNENKLILLARGSNSQLMAYGHQSSRVVLKSVSSASRKQQLHLRNEFLFLKELHHEHIIRALRYQEKVATTGNTNGKQSLTKNIMVLEYAQEGSLLNYIQKHVLKVTDKKEIFRDIADALNYLHGKGIAHRDLKLENILVCKQDGEVSVKVSDFGFASRIKKNEEIVRFNEYKGTRKGYMAPEIHNCQYEKDKEYEADKCDIFALGVILFALVMGKLPFELATEENKLYKMIIEKKYDEFWSFHHQVTRLENEDGFRREEFQQLFQRMVEREPNERPSAEEVLKCSWII